MRPLTDVELLAVWEAGRGSNTVRRALLLLAAACPEAAPEALARLAVGRRDEMLLTLRAWTFGTNVEALVRCPVCDQSLEVECRVAELYAVPVNGEIPSSVDAGGMRVGFRLPDSFDLLEASACGSLAEARQTICERCLTPPEGVRASDLSDKVLAAVAEAIAAADPQATVTLDLDCPDCGEAVNAPWDMASFFWVELHAWAQRLFREVHTLARTYGWTEDAILALTPQRRRLYVEMIG